MDEELEANLALLLSEPEISSDDVQAGQLLKRHLIEIEAPPTVLEDQPGTVKQINILLSQEGDVTVATSRKIPNLKFHLGEFLLEAVGNVVSLPNLLDNPAKLALAAIKFLGKVYGLAKVDIEAADAKVLIAIYLLKQQHEVPTLDSLTESVVPGISEQQIARSLANLEQLACISLMMDEIILNEKIVIRRNG
ncbi:MAG TPA: hypothetical protein VF914_18420 [Chloroflexia bacterium]